MFLHWRVVAHFIVLCNVGSNPTDISCLPDAMRFQVEHLESVAGMSFSIPDEHATSTAVGQLAAQWSSTIHYTNLAKDVQIRDDILKN